MAPLSTFVAAAIIASVGISAHPGHNVAEEAAERAEFFRMKPRTVRDCAANLDRRGVTHRSIQRRRDLASALRTKRGLNGKPLLGRRDFSDYNFSHASTNAYTLETDENTIFADNSSCTLQSEVTQGPYYVNGEIVRQDVTEGQEGVPLYLDIQVIDTSTCEPVSAVFMDLWHCNSTGVYSGVVANGNGDSSDTTNLDNTALRGIQQTDEDGLVQFHTLFPGHYDGRATHIHIMTHSADSTTLASNGTLLSSNDSATHASHVGQLFFDQDLITQVSQVSPYSSSTAQIVDNSEDSILAQEADTTDPFVEYVLLGSDLSDGILAWISIGIDPTKDSEVNSAATHYESGGVANSGGMGGAPGGSDGGQGGNGTMSGSGPGNGTNSMFPSGSGSMPGSTGAPSGSSIPSGSSAASGTNVAGANPTSTGATSAAGVGSPSTSNSAAASSSSNTNIAATSSTGSAPGGSYGQGAPTGSNLVYCFGTLLAAAVGLMLW